MHALLVTTVFSLKTDLVLPTVAENVSVDIIAVISKAKAGTSALALSWRFMDEDNNGIRSSDFSGIDRESHSHRYAY